MLAAEKTPRTLTAMTRSQTSISVSITERSPGGMIPALFKSTSITP